MKITALASWYGSNRMLAENVGRALEGCSWVGVPFAGGMCELGHITARTLMVNDRHLHVMNLAAVVGNKDLLPGLIERLDALPFHPTVLSVAQRRCADRESGVYYANPPLTPVQTVDWALDYFVCAWMARNGTAGTAGEFKAGLSVRWEAGGGDSAVRFRSATESLRDWQKIMRRATFSTDDVFTFLGKCKDRAGHGIYCDPPFPGPGDSYKHKFSEADHRQLASTLAGYQECRVVCRFYDVPLIRELYPESAWTWNLLTGRKQTNQAAPEVLLVSDPKGA